jgi:hypothetical protein
MVIIVFPNWHFISVDESNLSMPVKCNLEVKLCDTGHHVSPWDEQTNKLMVFYLQISQSGEFYVSGGHFIRSAGLSSPGKPA